MALSPEEQLASQYSTATATANTDAELDNTFTEKLTSEQIAERKKARLQAKRGTYGQDSDLTLTAKSLWNSVNDLWDGTDFKANIEGNQYGMTNKIFGDQDATDTEAEAERQSLVDFYNAQEDDPNAKHKVYQLRLLDGYDEQGNPLYTYKTGIAKTSAAERYKGEYIKNGYEILSEKGFAGAEDWENKWHGNRLNLRDRTYGQGYNDAGDRIGDDAQLDAGYTEVYNTGYFDKGQTPEEIQKNKEYSEYLADMRAKQGFSGSDSVIDATQAGFAKAAVSTGDWILDVLTPGNNDWLDNAKKQENIDEFVGYNRENANKAIGEATGYWKQGKYANALWEMVKAPQVTAESLGMMAEMVIGAGKFSAIGKLARTAKGLGDAKDLTKAEKLIYGFHKAKQAGDKAKAAKFKQRLGKMGQERALLQDRVLSNAGFLATVGEQTNVSLEVRKENNGGVEPTPFEVAAVTAEKVLELGLDRMAFGKITGIEGGERMLKDAFEASTMQGKKRILAKIGEVAAGLSAAGVTEASQEYLQNWGQILSEQLGTKTGGDLAKVLSSQENIDSVLGATIAGAAGGLHMGAPSIVGGTIYDEAAQRDTFINSERTKYGKAAQEEIGSAPIDETPGLFDSFDKPDAQRAATDAIINDAVYKLDQPRAFVTSNRKKNRNVGIDEYLNESIQKIARINKVDLNDMDAMGVIAGGFLSRLNKNAINAEKAKPAAAREIEANIKDAYSKLLDGKIGFDKKVALEKLMEFHAARLKDTLLPELQRMEQEELQTGKAKGLSQTAKSEALLAVSRMGSIGEDYENMDDTDKAYFEAMADQFKAEINDIGKGKTAKQVREEIFNTGFTILGKYDKKAMQKHTADITNSALTGNSNEQALEDLSSFVDTRNTSKIGTGQGFDETTQKTFTFSPVQQNRHIQNIIDDNIRMSQIIRTEMIDKMSKRKSQHAEDTVTRLKEIKAKLDIHTKELRDAQFQLQEKAKNADPSKDTWNVGGTDANGNTYGLTAEQVQSLGYEDGAELRNIDTELARTDLTPDERSYYETQKSEVERRISNRTNYYEQNGGRGQSYLDGTVATERPVSDLDSSVLEPEEGKQEATPADELYLPVPPGATAQEAAYHGASIKLKYLAQAQQATSQEDSDVIATELKDEFDFYRNEYSRQKLEKEYLKGYQEADKIEDTATETTAETLARLQDELNSLEDTPDNQDAIHQLQADIQATETQLQNETAEPVVEEPAAAETGTPTDTLFTEEEIAPTEPAPEKPKQPKKAPETNDTPALFETTESATAKRIIELSKVGVVGISKTLKDLAQKVVNGAKPLTDKQLETYNKKVAELGLNEVTDTMSEAEQTDIINNIKSQLTPEGKDAINAILKDC